MILNLTKERGNAADTQDALGGYMHISRRERENLSLKRIRFRNTGKRDKPLNHTTPPFRSKLALN